MANYFQLSTGVRVASNQPIDGDRYIADSIASRDALIDPGQRAFEGLQVYVSGGTIAEIGLYILTTLVEWNSSTSVWTKLDGAGGALTIDDLTDVTITTAASGDTLVFHDGVWVNSGITEDVLLAGSGITLDTSVSGFITIDNTKYVSGLTINTTNNELDIELADGTHFIADLDYLVDTDSYVCGGTYDPRSGGTIDFKTNTGFEFAVSGISNGSLESLSDTIITTPTDNQILVFSGGSWINSAATMGGNNYLLADLISNQNVGGVSINDFFPSGTTFEDMFLNILAPELQPTKVDNYATLAGYTPSIVEVGASLSFTLTSTYNRGTIDSKDTHPDVYLTGDFTDKNYSGAGTVDETTGDVTHIATEGANTWTVGIDYASESSLYYTSRGNESTLFDAIHLNTGTISDSGSITAYYNYWIGESGSTMPTDSTTIRTLTSHYRTATNFGFTYVIPANNRYFAFYIKSPQKTIVHAYHQESSNAENKDNFVITGPITVNDANGVGVDYYKYEQNIGGTGYSANATYIITIG